MRKILRSKYNYKAIYINVIQPKKQHLHLI